MGFIPKLEKAKVKAIEHDSKLERKATWAHEVESEHSSHSKHAKGGLTFSLSPPLQIAAHFISLSRSVSWPLILSPPAPQVAKS